MAQTRKQQSSKSSVRKTNTISGWRQKASMMSICRRAKILLSSTALCKKGKSVSKVLQEPKENRSIKSKALSINWNKLKYQKSKTGEKQTKCAK